MKVGIYNSCTENAIDATASVLGNLLARHYESEIICFQEDISKTPIDEAVSVRIIERPPQIVTDPNSPDRRYQTIRDWSNELTKPYDLFINIADRVPIYCSAPRGVLLIQSPHDFVPTIYRAFWQAHLDSYQLKLANSYYTRFWTNVLWELNCEVLYPPVSVLKPDQKDKLIVFPTKFDARNRDGQLMLISVFKELKTHLQEWSLTMLGS